MLLTTPHAHDAGGAAGLAAVACPALSAMRFAVPAVAPSPVAVGDGAGV